MGIKEGILTLLADAPKYGYQLKREFEMATGEAWTLNVGQVYTTLQRLERDKLVVPDEAAEEGHQRYLITDLGRGAVSEWMANPVERSVANRDALSIKVLLSMTSGVTDPAMVIGVQRAATMTALQDYQRLRTDSDGGDLAWMLHLDRLALQAEAELRWLDRVEDRIKEIAATRRPLDVEGTKTDPVEASTAGGFND